MLRGLGLWLSGFCFGSGAAVAFVEFWSGRKDEATPKPERDPVKVLQEQAKDRPPGVPVVKIPRPARKGA